MSISQNYPAIRPSLNLNFARSRSLDPRITFTRASTATFTDEDGLIKTAVANAPRFNFDPVSGECLGLLVEEARTNLLLRSQEINDTNSWSRVNVSVNPNVAVAPDGTLTANKLIAANGIVVGSTRVGQSITKAAVATTYTLSAFAKTGDVGTGSLQLVAIDGASSANNAGATFSTTLGTITVSAASNGTFSNASATITPFADGWYRCSLTFTTSTETGIQVRLLSRLPTPGDGTSGLLIWGAQLEEGTFATSYTPSTTTFTSRASSATYFDSTGTLQTAGTNVARTAAFLPDSGGVFRSAGPLLLEGASTNSVRNNTMVGAVMGTPGTLPTNWTGSSTVSGVTREIIGTGTENGISYIDVRCSGTTTAPIVFIIRPENTGAIAAANGQTWSSSLYVKLVGGSLINISLINHVIAYTNSANADLQFGTGGIVPTTAALGTQRFTRTTVSTDAATAFVHGYLQIEANTGVAIDITLRIGLPQLEQNPFATSVIVTSGATATRSADVSSTSTTTRATDAAIMTGTNFSTWYNPTEGTVFANYAERALSVAHTVAAFSDGTNNERITLTFNASNTLDVTVVSGGIDTFSGNTLTLTAQEYRIGFGYRADNSGVSVNGSAITVDSAVTLPTVSQLNIGARAGNSQILNSTIKRLTYYPVRLSDSQLQSLTK